MKKLTADSRVLFEFVKKYGDGHEQRILRRIVRKKPKLYREGGEPLFVSETTKRCRRLPGQPFFCLVLGLLVTLQAAGCPAADGPSESIHVTPAVGCSVCPSNTVCESIEGEDTVVLCVPGGSKAPTDTSGDMVATADDIADGELGDMSPVTDCTDLACNCTNASGCLSGLCLPAQFGGMCTIPCQTKCPDDWQCAQIVLAGEAQKVCIPQNTQSL